jgi:hypothetical protein
MAKQYGQNRRPEDRKEVGPKEVPKGISPVRRYNDHVHSGQLLWSFAVALCLMLAALLQWTSPKNALMEQDRAPAQIRLDLSNQGS